MARYRSRRNRLRSRKQKGGRRRNKTRRRSKSRRKRGGMAQHLLPLSLFALQRLAMSRHAKKSNNRHKC